MNSHHLPISYSRLSRFRKCPKLFLLKDDQKETLSKRLGKAAHKLILEGEKAFEAAYKRAPLNESTGKEFGLDTKAVQAFEQEHGCKALQWLEYEELFCMLQSVQKHEDAARILAGAKPEVHVKGTVNGIPAHGYVDAVHRRHFAELKTCHDIDSFESDARRFRYANQAAFYRSLLAASKECDPREIEAFFIAVETSAPFRCGVWRVGAAVLAEAEKQNANTLYDLAYCLNSNIWRSKHDKLQEFDWI